MEWRELCQEKEREWREKEIEEIKKVKNESEIWQFLKGSDKKKEKVDNEITKEQWKEHFRSLLEGSNSKKVGQKRKKDEEMEEKEKAKISIKEIRLAWKMLKKRKAAGSDVIPNEV